MHKSACLNYSTGQKEPFYMIPEEHALCEPMFTEHAGGRNWKFAPGQ